MSTDDKVLVDSGIVQVNYKFKVIVPDITKTQIVEGDTLVFTFRENLTHAERFEIGESINVLFPKAKYIILDNGSQLEIMHEDK